MPPSLCLLIELFFLLCQGRSPKIHNWDLLPLERNEGLSSRLPPSHSLSLSLCPSLRDLISQKWILSSLVVALILTLSCLPILRR
jgi:hypothetical protein